MATSTAVRKYLKGTPGPKPAQGRSSRNITGTSGNTRSRSSTATKAIDKALSTPVTAVSNTGMSGNLTGVTKTKGGDYPVYSKTSAKGIAFNKAYGDAKRAGKKRFSWEGRSYSVS